MESNATLSLLSLSTAAASLPRQPITTSSPVSASTTTVPAPPPSHAPKTRRLSSAGQTRRRLSDAASAVARLSISSATSPPSSGHLAATIAAQSLDDSALITDDHPTVGTGGEGKKKGQIFKCETCAKVYRHPSCLVKHRWEHSPHWREASKFLLSKHQQVQMLEAAAILSNITPPGTTSLPEDRSLWPSYLSGGLLPAPNGTMPIPSKLPSKASSVSVPPRHAVAVASIPVRRNRPRSASIKTSYMYRAPSSNQGRSSSEGEADEMEDDQDQEQEQEQENEENEEENEGEGEGEGEDEGDSGYGSYEVNGDAKGDIGMEGMKAASSLPAGSMLYVPPSPVSSVPMSRKDVGKPTLTSSSVVPVPYGNYSKTSSRTGSHSHSRSLSGAYSYGQPYARTSYSNPNANGNSEGGNTVTSSRHSHSHAKSESFTTHPSAANMTDWRGASSYSSSAASISGSFGGTGVSSSFGGMPGSFGSGYPGSGIGIGIGIGRSVALPRSSVRGGEINEDDDEEEDVLDLGRASGSGSGRAGSDEWEGMAMDMEL